MVRYSGSRYFPQTAGGSTTSESPSNPGMKCWKKVFDGNCWSGGHWRSFLYRRAALSHSSKRKLSQVEDASNTAALIFGCRSKKPDIRTEVTHNAASAWKFCTLDRKECGTPDEATVRRTNSAPECCSV